MSYPYLGFRFNVEIIGLITGGFSDISGLQFELETENYREGGVNGFEHKLPKGIKYPNLVLKRGVVDADLLWLWYKAVLNGIIDRKIITIRLRGPTALQQQIWVFTGAYPVKWIGPELKAESSQVAVEALEFAHNGLLL